MGKFLLKEREEYAFPGPQVQACTEQQPGALCSERDMQTMSVTGIVEEAAFQSGIRLTSASQLPFDEVAVTEDMLFSAARSVQNKTHSQDRGGFAHRAYKHCATGCSRRMES